MACVPNSINQPILDIPSVWIPINRMHVDKLHDSWTSVRNSFKFLQFQLFISWPSLRPVPDARDCTVFWDVGCDHFTGSLQPHDLNYLLLYQIVTMKLFVSYSHAFFFVLQFYLSFFQNTAVWCGAPSLYGFTLYGFLSSYTIILTVF